MQPVALAQLSLDQERVVFFVISGALVAAGAGEKLSGSRVRRQEDPHAQAEEAVALVERTFKLRSTHKHEGGVRRGWGYITQSIEH